MDWLNDNSDAIQALATGVLVIVTVIYAGLVLKQVRASETTATETRRLAEETQRLAEETRRQGRPYVYMEVLNNTGFLETHIRNVGARVAKNVIIKVKKDLPIPGSEHRGFLTHPVLATPIPALSPGGVVKETVANYRGVSGALRQLPPEERILAYEVEYYDGEDHYCENLQFDLSHLLESGRPFPEPDVFYSLAELRAWLTSAINRTNDILSEMAQTFKNRSPN